MAAADSVFALYLSRPRPETNHAASLFQAKSADINDAYAYAIIGNGAAGGGAIVQTATAALGNAAVAFTNNGTATVAANANASGVTYASASASVHSGVYQSANAAGGGATQGAASASVTNNGTLNIEANATAAASTGAGAYALVD